MSDETDEKKHRRVKIVEIYIIALRDSVTNFLERIRNLRATSLFLL
jgi:hypothetical protein